MGQGLWEFKKALRENVEAGRTIGRIHFDWWLGSYGHTGMDCVQHVLEMTENGFLTEHPAIHMKSHSSNTECAFEISKVIKEIHELTGRPTSR